MNIAVEINKPSAREEMARCALELFGINGYKQTTIAEIARLAGYHVQTFYRHFSSKEELVAEIWRQSYEQFKTHFESRGKLTAIDSWRNYVKENAKLVTADSHAWGLDDQSSIPVLTAECQAYQDQYRTLLAEGIAQDLNVNSKNNIQPMLLACTLFDGNSVTARQWVGKKFNKKAYIESLLRVVDETKLLFDQLKTKY